MKTVLFFSQGDSIAFYGTIELSQNDLMDVFMIISYNRLGEIIRKIWL